MQRETDPDNLITHLPRGNDGDVLVLGLDLGTQCGCAFTYLDPAKPVNPATMTMHMALWDLSAGQYDSGAIRFVRLRRFLHVMQPALIGYERPRYTPASDTNRVNVHAIVARAATSLELFGAFMGTVATWADERGVPCEGFPIGTIKKRATDKGNAGKPAMIEACNEMFGTDFGTADYQQTGVDNVADAAFVCLLTAENYAGGF